MKTKITIDLPSVRDLLRGLTPAEVHPALARAKEAATAAETALAKARADLADHERRVAELPGRVHRGEVKAEALTEAIRQRDARALIIPECEAALAKARARLPVEESAAKQALEREVHRRLEQLERTAAELAPVLERLNELSRALVMVVAPTALGGFSSVDWPCASFCAGNQRAFVASRNIAKQPSTGDQQP